MMRNCAAVIGAVNIDVCGRPNGRLLLRDSNPGVVRYTPGGVGRNIAHNLRLLGTEVHFLTVFGDDPFGRMLCQDCAERGMHLELSEQIPGMRTSTYLYITDEQGEMQLALSDTDISRCITPAFLAERLPRLENVSAVVIDANLTEETLAWIAEHVRTPLFADPVSVAKAARLRPVLPKLHTFKPNLAEGRSLTGRESPEDVVSALLDLGVRRVFLSLGSDGMLAGEGESRVMLPCLPTRMVNTNGGGDAAMAALVWAFLHGKDLEASTMAALRAGRCAVEYDGTNNPALCADLLKS